MISWVNQNDVKIIHLVRYNLLKRLVSHKIANTRNLNNTRKALKPIKINVDPKILLKDFRKRQKRFEEYRRKFRDIPFLEVSYESMLDDHQTEMKRILKFLGVDQLIPLTTDLVKMNPDSLGELIENYNEVKQTLMNTEFENFLY
jgi:hypothetical protein